MSHATLGTGYAALGRMGRIWVDEEGLQTAFQ